MGCSGGGLNGCDLFNNISACISIDTDSIEQMIEGEFNFQVHLR